MDIEINVSCPNVEHSLVCSKIQGFLGSERKWCSIKLAPTTDMKTIDNYYKQGFRKFHCCNTYPTPNGGLSGQTLIPYVCKLTSHIKTKYPDTEVISGGGIRYYDTLNIYKIYGADHYSVSTLLFNPIFPIYLDKSMWIPIDIIVGVFFGVSGLQEKD